MKTKAESSPSDVQRKFDALIEHFPDMIHSVDGSGRLVYVNAMASQLLGFGREELLAMNIRQLYPPEILEAVERGFQEVKQGGDKTVESLLMAKDGTRIPVELRTLALQDATGSFAKTFTVSRDLRPLKEMQQNLIHAGRLAAIGELAAGVVHDLNNPLTAVIMASAVMRQTLQAEGISDLPDQVMLYCETIDQSAETMKNLTTRLRDFARGVKEQHAPVDLFDPLRDALFILTHRLRNGRIAVRCPVVKAAHWVLGDRNQIEQVFLNLLANACDAMEARPVRELEIDVQPLHQGGRSFWCCSVSDTGAGIPQEVQDQVFKAFFTTKPRGKGTGLGLSITRSILKEHNATVQLESVPDRGTTFRLVFPAHNPVPSGDA